MLGHGLSMLLASASLSQAPSFSSLVGIPVAPGPSFALADLDRDGRQDIVVSSFADATVEVLLSRPGTAPERRGPFAVGYRPGQPAIADVDDDGRLDVAVASIPTGVVTVLHATAGGSITRTDHPGPPAAGQDPSAAAAYAVAAGDVTRDGRVDLAVTGPDSDTVTVLAGQAGGGFAAPVAHATGVRPHAVVIADADDDGRADIVTTNADGDSISVLRGEPGGTLAAHADQPIARHTPIDLLVRDLDADGRTEIAVGVFGGAISVRRADGSEQLDYRFDDYLIGIAAADLDGDGRLDLTSVTRDRIRPLVLLGRGGGFAPLPLYGAEAYPRSAGHMATGDIDGDGRPDLVVTENDQVGVRYNRTPVASLLAPARTSANAVALDWSVDAFRSVVSALELQVQPPGAPGWTPVKTIADPAESGTVDFGDLPAEGEYRFRLLARDHGGRVLEVSEPAEAATRVVRTTTLALEAPAFGALAVGVAGEPRPVRITNTGEIPLMVSDLRLSGDGFSLAATTCSAAIAPGASCEVPVRLLPAKPGELKGELRLRANTAAGTHSIAFSGTGLAEDPPLAPAVVAPLPAPETPPSPGPTTPVPARPRLAFSFLTGPKTTRLIGLRLEGLVAGTTVTVRCPRGCSQTRLTKRNAKGTVSLAAFTQRRLRTGTTIRVTVAAPGAAPLQTTLRIRAGRAPSTTSRPLA